MNRTEQRMIKQKCWKRCTNIGGAEGKCCHAEKIERFDSAPVAV